MDPAVINVCQEASQSPHPTVATDSFTCVVQFTKYGAWPCLTLEHCFKRQLAGRQRTDAFHPLFMNANHFVIVFNKAFNSGRRARYIGRTGSGTRRLATLAFAACNPA